MLLTAINNLGITTLFNPVELQAHDFLPRTQSMGTMEAVHVEHNHTNKSMYTDTVMGLTSRTSAQSCHTALYYYSKEKVASMYHSKF